MALMVREKLDAKKHVFVDWSLVEPGYAVSWADALGTEWETPQGRPARGREATRRGRADGRDGAPLGDLLHPAHDDHRRRWPLPPLLHLSQPDGGRRQIGGASRTPTATTSATPSPRTASSGPSRPSARSTGGARRRTTSSTARTAPWAGRYLRRRSSKTRARRPRERYKIIHRGKRSDGARCVYGATSPDGIDWHAIEEPVIPEYFSDTQIVARYDEDRGVYCGYFRGWTTHLLRAGPTDAAPSPTPRRRTSGAGRSRRLSSRPMSTTTPAPTSTRTATPCGPTPTRT